MILIYGLIMLNTGIPFTSTLYVSDYHVPGCMTEEPHTAIHTEDTQVFHNDRCCCFTNYLFGSMMRVVTCSSAQFANIHYAKSRTRNIILVTGSLQLPKRKTGEFNLLAETRLNILVSLLVSLLSTFKSESFRRWSNIDQKQHIPFRSFSTRESASLQQWSNIDHVETVSFGLLSTWGSGFEERRPNIDHVQNVSSELLSTWDNTFFKQRPNIDHVQTVSSELLSTWDNTFFKQRPNIDHVQTVSSELLSTWDNTFLKQRPNIDHVQTVSSELLSTWDNTFLKQWSNMNRTRSISFRLLSTWESVSIDHNVSFVSSLTWKNGSFGKWSNVYDKQPNTQWIFLVNEDIYFKNSYQGHCMESYHDNSHCCWRALQLKRNGIFDNNSHMDRDNNTDVFQISNQLEKEIQRFNILYHTSCSYFLRLIMNKYQRDNHLLSSKPDISSNQQWLVLFQLINYILCCWFLIILNPRYIYHLFHGHPSLQKKIYWFIFCMLTTCSNVFVYFPTLLPTIHQLRSKLLHTLYPVVSPAYEKMIYRRHRRYKREIINTKMKMFFQFYVKWLKAFDREKKYVRSAHITDTCLKKERKKYQGGRKRKCSFRKTGPFIYGKTLNKRHSLQKTTHLAHAFKLFMKTLQKGFNHAFISTQCSLTKAAEKVSDFANNTIDIFRLRRILFQTHMAVYPFLDPSMQNEFSRVATYATFPTNTPVSSLRLARAGFFYTGQSDVVECFHCHVQHGNWDRFDLPIEIHRRKSPSCDFVTGRNTQNISIDRLSIESGSFTSLTHTENCDSSIQNRETSGELHTLSSVDLYQSTCSEQSSTYPSTGPECSSENPTKGCSSTGSGHPEVLSYDSIGYSNQCSEQSLPTTSNQCSEYHETAASSANKFEICKHSIGQNGSATESELQNKQADFKSTKIVKRTNSKTKNVPTVQLKPLSECHDRPKHITYAVITVRMSSFKGWSSYTGQTPKELAAAGLFYSGYADVVICWFCGIRLQSWETNDDPWIEHAKWAPTCVFLRRSKGDEFILLVHERNTHCSHSAKGSEKDSTHMTSAQYGPEEIQTPLQLAVSIEKVKAMGYSTGIIKKAIEKLQRDNIPIDTCNIVVELTGNDMAYFNSKPEPAKVCELTWNTTGYAHEVNPCSDGTTEAMNKLDIQETNCLMEETRRLKKDMKCKICIDMDADITFVPCGHLVCCEGCGYVVAKCPLCRNVIEMRVKTLML